MAAKEKKGLGTGLGVLFGEDTYTDENELKQLPVSRLEPRREQPRTVFDDAALQELAESLRRYGVIQPVTARKLDNGFYQIIAGERRWRAARLAGLEEIPVRVIEADDRRTAELALVENLQREDLNPIEEARGYQALIDEYGMTQEEAAQSVGRSRPAITNALRLLSLSPAVLSLVEEGKLSAGHARALLPITEEKAQKAAADEVLKKSLSVRRTEQLAARQLKEKKAPETAKGPDGVDYAADVSET
ncbi:MAG TPA: stage 0 sporulation protein J, partial [Clostridiales bacterium]|nr:stage 0 sporulation protein J [Clostridiales bacterium]